MGDQDERWDAVATAIEARMAELALSQAELIRKSGVSAWTVPRLIKGVPGNYRASNLQKVSLALGWPADAIESMRDGKGLGATPGSLRPLSHRVASSLLYEAAEDADDLEAAMAVALDRLTARLLALPASYRVPVLAQFDVAISSMEMALSDDDNLTDRMIREAQETMRRLGLGTEAGP